MVFRSDREALIARTDALESEVGELPSGLEPLDPGEASFTDPSLAEDFVRRTGVDLLSVSVGNVHIKLNGRAALDLQLLARLHQVVDVPLVLHGGSGIEDASVAAAIELGVAKINYGTSLKQRYLAALRETLAAECANPHEVLGMGEQNDVIFSLS